MHNSRSDGFGAGPRALGAPPPPALGKRDTKMLGEKPTVSNPEELTGLAGCGWLVSLLLGISLASLPVSLYQPERTNVGPSRVEQVRAGQGRAAEGLSLLCCEPSTLLGSYSDHICRNSR